MSDKPRYLLGYGKPLEPVKYIGGPGGGEPPYPFSELRQHLGQRLQQLEVDAARLPEEALPDGQAVAVVRLHTTALSRSAFPDGVLRQSGLRLLGSRSSMLRPRAGRGSDLPAGLPSTDLFVAGTRDNFDVTLALLFDNRRLVEGDPLAEDFSGIEDIRLMLPTDRVKSGITKKTDDLEVVLHYNATRDRRWRQIFSRFANSVGVELDSGLELQRNDLLFMTASATREAAEALAQFTFLRAVRPLPAPRPLEKPTVLRSTKTLIKLPIEPAMDPKVRMAIFDGGLPADHGFKTWVRAIEPPSSANIGTAVPDFVDHGIAVTSAALFDSVKPGTPLPVPFCNIDHYRVLGTETGGKKGLYRSLAWIDEVLTQRKYHVISLSIGPPEPIDDDRVSAWTTLLDDHLGDADVVAFVAVGNNGEENVPDNRIMAPADAVNAIAVGACTSATGDWERTSYSAVGPGRNPGLVKPDVVYFGGDDNNPFLFIHKGQILQEFGTSFSAPAMGRLSTGLRAHFGDQFTGTAIRAITVHSADPNGHSLLEVGFGRVPWEIGRMTICEPGTVRVIYQGKLRPGGTIRAPITVPPGLTGKVHIAATAAFSCRTDPNTPGEYTRAALDIKFRPDHTKHKIDPKTKKVSFHAATDSFFRVHDNMAELELRLDGQKWCTMMHAEKPKFTSSLNEPVFDIHYIARVPGQSTAPGDAPELQYALVISLSSKKVKNLYELVMAAFPEVLQVIEPDIDIEPPVEI